MTKKLELNKIFLWKIDVCCSSLQHVGLKCFSKYTLKDLVTNFDDVFPRSKTQRSHGLLTNLKHYASSLTVAVFLYNDV